MRNTKLFTRASLTVAGLLAIGGCAGAGKYVDLPMVAPTSVVQINQQLEIPPELARVYIQNGIHSGKRGLDKWLTYCSVLMQEVNTPGEPLQTVSPGKFEISQVREYNDYRYQPRIYASLTRVRYDPPSDVIYTVEMRLQSEQQPGVRALICVRHVAAYGRYYPTLAEIRVALGDVIEINMP